MPKPDLKGAKKATAKSKLSLSSKRVIAEAAEYESINSYFLQFFDD